MSDGPASAADDTQGAAAPIDLLVDWDLAARTASRIAGPGPTVSPADAARAVEELRSAAQRSAAHVAQVTSLDAGPAGGVLVVDRAGWAKANTVAFRELLAPAVAEALERRDRRPGAALSAVGSRVTGAEVGGLLGLLAGRVLGQYDAFGPVGRLMLVAPNIVHVERELAVDPSDFRLWVCLHEETHRVQFTANPWLAGHLVDRIRALVSGLLADPAEIADRLAGAVRALPELLRGGEREGEPTGSGVAILDAVQTPEQRAELARLTAVMSLLEGHADVVMDDVGPSVVPSVEHIRARFSARRRGRGVLDQLMRRLLGLEAKMRQYADGARFVRGVTEKVGTEGFNQVWTSPETLPLPAEIADPHAWVARVHG